MSISLDWGGSWLESGLVKSRGLVGLVPLSVHHFPSRRSYRVTELMRDLVRRSFWVKCYRLPAVGLGVSTYINGTRFPQLGSAVMVAAAPRCGDAWVPVGCPAQSGQWSLLPACQCVPAIICALCRGLPVRTALTLAAILAVDAQEMACARGRGAGRS